MTKLGNPPARRVPARLSKLLDRGVSVQLTQDGEEPVFLWVRALTKIQREEAVRAGMVASQVSKLNYTAGNPDFDALVRSIIEEETSNEDLAYAIIGANKSHKIWVDAEKDVLTLPFWNEEDSDPYTVLNELTRKQEEEPELFTEEDANALFQLNQRWMADWTSQAEVRTAVEASLLMAMSRETLIADCVSAMISARSASAQMAEYDRVAVAHATRICEAAVGADDILDHSPCGGHQERLFPHPKYVDDLDENILASILEGMQFLDSAADALGGEGLQRAQR